MTLLQVIRQLQTIASTQPNVRVTGEGDLYRDRNAQGSNAYDCFYITQNQHQSEGDWDRYSFNLFYISRLESEDAGNALQVQSVGKEVITNVVRIFCDKFDCEVYGTTYWQSFTQRFSDLCAGIYAIITIMVPKDSTCIDD